MNKKGAVLIFGLLVILTLSILASSFYFKSINADKLTRRYVESSRAFWLAEAGIAEALSNLPAATVSGYIGSSSYTYSAQVVQVAGTANYYTISSTGSVALQGSQTIDRSLSAIIRTGIVNPAKFQYAIGTTTNLVVKGSVEINPVGSFQENAILDFADLFGISKADMKLNAAGVYTLETFPSSVSGITWVDVPTGSTLNIAGGLIGSGILVINGNAHFSGTVQFSGIIYVIGKLTMTGDVTATGSVLAESSATVDTILKGNVTLNYDPLEIAGALSPLQFLNKNIVCWQEVIS
jgi:Tfp pilus assembly protein PilX